MSHQSIGFDQLTYNHPVVRVIRVQTSRCDGSRGFELDLAGLAFQHIDLKRTRGLLFVRVHEADAVVGQ